MGAGPGSPDSTTHKEDRVKRVSVIALFVIAACASPALAEDTLWARTYSGQGAEMDQGRAVACIGTDIYVTVQEMAPEPNVVVIRYRANGDTAWARTFNLDTMEQPVDIVVGSDSGPVVGVQVMGASPAYRVIKLSKAGDTVWTRKQDGVSVSNIALDASDNVYVFGSAFGTMPDESLCLVKYTSAGSQEWRKTWRLGVQHKTGGAVCDQSGNVLGAYMVQDSTGPRFGFAKFSSAGDSLFTAYPAEFQDLQVQSIAVDPEGFILVGATRGPQCLVARCSTNGRVSWLRPVPAALPAPEGMNMLAAGADTCVYIGATDPGQNGIMVKLNREGVPVWTGNSMLTGMFFGVALDAERRSVLVGMNQTPPLSALTVKFILSSGLVEGAQPEPRGRGSAIGVTLAGSGSAVSVQIQSAGNYSVNLYDARGAVVQRLHNGSLGVGNHSFKVGKLASGQYYLKVAGKSGAIESKLVQVR
jgi:hypothetical protein